jgi:hypothetical protein
MTQPVQGPPASAGKPEPQAPPQQAAEGAVPQQAADEAPDAAPVCPRCGGKLNNPDGLGWCPGCGYCRSLAEEKAAVVQKARPPRKKPSLLGATDLGEAIKRMPGWGWVLLGGAAAVAGASVAADRCLPEEGLPRALWSAVQIVVCLFGIIATQLWAVMLVGAREDGIRAADLITGGRVWRAVFRRLPATRKPLWLGTWCLTGLVCAALVVGGFDYWLEGVRALKVRHMAAQLQAGEPLATAKQPIPVALPSLDALGAGPGETRSVAPCAVIGYQSDGAMVTGLLIAVADGNELKFAGVVKAGLSPEEGDDLMKRLSRLERDTPLIPGLKMRGARWVKPGLFCDVFHTGTDKDGHLERPAVKQFRE